MDFPEIKSTVFLVTWKALLECTPWSTGILYYTLLAVVIPRVDNAIYCLKFYLVGTPEPCFNMSPLDRDLCVRYHYPPFAKLSPKC